MDRVTKEAQVSELKDKLGRVASIVLADYRGLDVPTVTSLRDEFRKVQCEYKVFKNTLVKLAIKGTPSWRASAKHLEGPTAIIFSLRDPVGAGQGRHQVRQGRRRSSSSRAATSRARCSTPRASRASRRCPARTSCGRRCSRRFMAPATDFVAHARRGRAELRRTSWRPRSEQGEPTSRRSRPQVTRITENGKWPT